MAVTMVAIRMPRVWPAVLHCADPGQAEAPTSARIGSPLPVRRTRRPPVGSPALQRPARSVRGDVLDERMPRDDHSCTAILFEAAHRSQPRLQPAVVALDAVVAIPIGALPCR